VSKSCITVGFTYSLRMAIFLHTDISQGSVATRFGCGGVFVYNFVANFLLSLTVKEFWKSVNIWWSYGQELGVLFFLTHSVVASMHIYCVLAFVAYMGRVQCWYRTPIYLPVHPSHAGIVITMEPIIKQWVLQRSLGTLVLTYQSKRWNSNGVTHKWHQIQMRQNQWFSTNILWYLRNSTT